LRATCVDFDVDDGSGAIGTEQFAQSRGREPGRERIRDELLNRGESDLLITIVGDLLSANPDLVASDIGIISPYYLAISGFG
jgi:hypothetical protein